MKKFFGIFLVLLFWGLSPVVAMDANIKPIKAYKDSEVLNFSCTIQEQYSEKTTKNLTELAKECNQIGLKDLSQAIEAGSKQGKAGIGFIYTGSKNRNYIITNRHTVENGASFVVTVTDSNGVSTKYTDVSVISLNHEYDLAVMAFAPKVRPLKTGLNFNEEYSSDVEKFLSGEALNFVVAEDDDYEDEEYEEESTEELGLVLRFNVPEMQEIVHFAEVGKKSEESENPGEEVYENAIEFGEYVGFEETEYENLVPYISKRMIQDSGKQIFLDVQKRCPYTDWNDIKPVFLNVSPMEGLRYVISWYVLAEYNNLDFGANGQKGHKNRKSIPVEIQPPDIKANTEDWNVVYNLPGKHRHAVTSWTFEYGRWRLLSFKLGGPEYSINSDDFNHLGAISLYQPSLFVASNGYENSFIRDTSYFTQYVDFEVRMLNWLSVDSTIKLCSYNYPVFNQGNGLIGGVFEYAELQAGAKFLMPMYFKYVILSPYGAVKLGARVGGFKNGLYFDLTGNIDTAARFTWFVRRLGLTVFEDTGVRFNLDSIVKQTPEGKRFTPNVSLFIGVGVGY